MVARRPDSPVAGRGTPLASEASLLADRGRSGRGGRAARSARSERRCACNLSLPDARRTKPTRGAAARADAGPADSLAATGQGATVFERGVDGLPALIRAVMFDTLQHICLAAALVFDTVLLVALLEKRNWPFVRTPILWMVAGAWLLHGGLFALILLIDLAGSWPWYMQSIFMLATAAGLLLMPCG